MKPLVSILIPAYNAERWLGDTIQSALAQTWSRKEIIVIDDGSRDETLAIARKFSSNTVSVVAQENQGASAARNKAYNLCQGEYIQWLDADDLLAPDKIERQMAVAMKSVLKRTLFSGTWGYFMYRLLGDDDGEYFSRVINVSSGIRFVPESRVYYRIMPGSRLSYIGRSKAKMEAQFLGMKLQIGYLRAREDSARVRAACVTYLRNWLHHFYLARPDILQEAQQLACTLGDQLHPPRMSWKYAWIEKLFGWALARHTQLYYNQCKSSVLRAWDKMVYSFERLSRLLNY
jgi:glycosyltransferase involved in cell wall biosynthesis